MANEYDKILRENFRQPKERLLKQLIPINITRITPLAPRLQQTKAPIYLPPTGEGICEE